MNTKFARNRDEEDDDEESFSRKNKVQFYKKAYPSFELIVNLNNGIMEPDHYFELVEEMQSLSENDVVNFRVNSPGGRVDGLVYLLNAIRDCEAPVIGTLSGEAASAATVLLLSCDGVQINPYSTMMIHSASFGGHNHQSNMVSHAVFADQQCREILTDAYKDFLSTEELSQIFSGLELRLNYTQITERLERRDEIRKQRFQEEMEAREKAETLAQKPPRKKKAPSQE